MKKTVQFLIPRCIAGLLFVLVSCGSPVGGDGDGETPPSTPETPTRTKTGIRIKSPPAMFVYPRNQPYSAEGLEVEWLWSDGSAEGELTPAEYTLSPATVDTAEPGVTQIVVTSRSGNFTAQYPVAVNNSDKMLTGISITTQPAKTAYQFGENFSDSGMVVTGTYSDSSTRTESTYFVSGYDRTLRGTQTLTVKVNQFPATFNVQVRIPASATATVNGYTGGNGGNIYDSYQSVYYKGQTVSGVPERLKVTVTANGVTAALTPGHGISPAEVSGFTAATPGTQNLTLTLDDKTLSFPIYVLDVNPEVFFDYGYRRTADKPNGENPNGTAQYTVPAGRSLVITPTLFLVGIGSTPSYSWSPVDSGLNSSQSGAGNKYLTVRPTVTGTYHATVTVGERTATATVVCTPALPGSPPAEAPAGTIKHFAPGQFTVSGTGFGWSLGTQGGYQIWRLRRINDGTRNIVITGNPMSTWSEPGVVWVSLDANGNGYPDDTWYELKGSEDSNYPALITREYPVRYLKSGGGEALNEYGQRVANVYWVDGKGRSGIMRAGWPTAWGVSGDWVTHTGTLLRDNGFIGNGSSTGEGSRLITNMYGDGGWGYVDSMATRANFSIADAIQRDGSAANLPYIDFVKVQTAAFRYGDGFGEISTEIKSADGLGSQTSFPSP